MPRDRNHATTGNPVLLPDVAASRRAARAGRRTSRSRCLFLPREPLTGSRIAAQAPEEQTAAAWLAIPSKARTKPTTTTMMPIVRTMAIYSSSIQIQLQLLWVWRYAVPAFLSRGPEPGA